MTDFSSALLSVEDLLQQGMGERVWERMVEVG